MRVQQNVPLIRVRNEASDLPTRVGRWVQRRLTKRCKSFYFSLANADRAGSYHLSFSGPGQSYYAESEIVTIHPDGTPLRAERMTATCRCDQVDSQLYVKGGAGFHNAALSFVYEGTNHRSLQTICVSTAICLVLICFTAFKFILPFDSLTGITEKDTSLQIVAIFFSVMTFAGLMSVWESLSGQRSEEWVWVSASVTMASSLIGLADLIYLITSNGTLGLFFHQVLWSLLVLVEFSIFILVLISLFYKVKLHSSFMARVPLTRSLVRDASSGKRDAKKGAPHANKSDEKKGKKKFDEAEMYYEDLVGCYWADGWLLLGRWLAGSHLGRVGWCVQGRASRGVRREPRASALIARGLVPALVCCYNRMNCLTRGEGCLREKEQVAFMRAFCRTCDGHDTVDRVCTNGGRSVFCTIGECRKPR